MACLYNNAFKWNAQEKKHESLGDSFNHFVVLTMNASSNIANIHHRMPVLLNDETKKLWLDPSVSFHDCFKAIMNTDVYKGLTFYEVSEMVNSVKNDVPEIILPKKDYDEVSLKKGIGRFFSKAEENKESTMPISPTPVKKAKIASEEPVLKNNEESKKSSIKDERKPDKLLKKPPVVLDKNQKSIMNFLKKDQS